MKKIISLFTLTLALCSLTSCGNDKNTITIGATPSPHAEILKSEAVQSYIKTTGYNLKVKVYQDYNTLNKALNDGGIDANYFQHINFLNNDIETYGYDLCAAAQIHNEPLNLYGKSVKTDWTNTKIYIINDYSNAERAFKLLLDNNLINSYDTSDFNPLHPIYTSEIGVTIECLDSGLLHQKVSEGGYAVIPGNYALTAWGADLTADYKIFGESLEVAYPNIIAIRKEDLSNEKIKILVDSLSQSEVKDFIEKTYGPTVNYVFKSFLQ